VRLDAGAGENNHGKLREECRATHLLKPAREDVNVNLFTRLKQDSVCGQGRESISVE
jgi:hypothetical protein